MVDYAIFDITKKIAFVIRVAEEDGIEDLTIFEAVDLAIFRAFGFFLHRAAYVVYQSIDESFISEWQVSIPALVFRLFEVDELYAIGEFHIRHQLLSGYNCGFAFTGNSCNDGNSSKN